MFEFITLSVNSYFTIALSIVIVISVIEIIGQFIGLSVGQLLDSSIDLNSGTSSIGGTLGWLGIGKLPTLIWLILFLTLFSIAGFVINGLTYEISATFLNERITQISAFVFAILSCKSLAGTLARFIPQEESSAISQESFSGRLAQITIGTAKKGMPAEAVFTDEHNQKHYVMVEPIEEEQFPQGTNVVLVEKKANHWLVINFE